MRSVSPTQRLLWLAETLILAALVSACQIETRPGGEASAQAAPSAASLAVTQQVIEPTSVEENTPLSIEDPQEAALIRFVLDELTGPDRQRLLVAQVEAKPGNRRSPMDKSLPSILRCWEFQDSVLSACQPGFFDANYRQEESAPWKYAYMAFSIYPGDQRFSSATVRVDRIPGLAGGKGELIELAREGNQWLLKSSSITWIR